MSIRLQGNWQGRALVAALLGTWCVSLSTFGAPASGEKAFMPTVPRATCGAGDHPESALQGQVPAGLRATGFQGFNCNLQLIGQSKGDGANWQTAEFKDSAGPHVRLSRHGVHHCGSHAPRRARHRHHRPDEPDTDDLSHDDVDARSMGVAQGERAAPIAGGGQRSQRRRRSGGRHLRRFGDCRFPQLLAAVAVGTATAAAASSATVVGHEGAWAPDGLTYYGGDLRPTAASTTRSIPSIRPSPEADHDVGAGHRQRPRHVHQRGWQPRVLRLARHYGPTI